MLKKNYAYLSKENKPSPQKSLIYPEYKITMTYKNKLFKRI